MTSFADWTRSLAKDVVLELQNSVMLRNLFPTRWLPACLVARVPPEEATTAVIGPLVEVRCPACQAEQPMEYIMIGAAVACSACRQPVVMARVIDSDGHYSVGRWGVVSQGSGYALTFPQTAMLFRYTDAPDLPEATNRRSQVAAVVHASGHTLQGVGRETQIVDDRGQVVDPVTLHRLIQSQPQLQYDLYQISMDISHQGY